MILYVLKLIQFVVMDTSKKSNVCDADGQVHITLIMMVDNA